MLHIAIRIANASGTEFLMATIVEMINEGRTTEHVVLADQSADGIKQKIRDRIALHPQERWLILSGNTIGELASPPVRFRSV